MKSIPCIVLATSLLAAPGCGSPEQGSAQPGPSAAASGQAQGQTAEVRVPRDTAAKLLDVCASPREKPAGGAPPAEGGEAGELAKDASGAASVQLFGIRPDSALGKATFLNGDRVTEINGVAAGQPKERWDSLRDAKRLDVRLVRRGAPARVALIIE